MNDVQELTTTTPNGPGRIKIAYVAGAGKSGSTMLGKLLGQVDGCFDVGELINIDMQFDKGEKCGCGEPVKDCPVWSEVVTKALGSIDGLDRDHWKYLKTRYMPVLLIPGARPRVRRFFDQVRRLHLALAELTGGKMTVDSSKSAFYGAVLSLYPEFEVYMLHIVRDVRGSEGSMHRLKSQGVGKWVNRGTWWNSVRWMGVNLITEWTAKLTGMPYMRVRYEDLVAKPGETLAEVTRLLGRADAGLGFLDGATANLGKTHTIAGSNVRFKEGPMELKLDERWKEQLPEHTKAVVDRLTRRFRRRYGY